MGIKIILLIIFFAVMAAVGIYSRRHVTSVDGFVLGGRSTASCDAVRLCGISSRFQLLSPSTRQVTHALLTRPHSVTK